MANTVKCKEKIILLGLNELNFDYIKYYISKGELINFKNLFDKNNILETTSEDKYELLEPWIQWLTVVTGMDYSEHQVYRLGDIVYRKDIKQIFEAIEEKGFKVGAVSPFNVENRLKDPAFFAPDPWTQTLASGSSIFTGLSNAVSQAVNDNAHGKLTKKSLVALVKGLGVYTAPKDYKFYINKIRKIKSQTGVKALVLDKLLADAFIKEWNKTSPDFANLFLNTGAHFQHHYMFNSGAYNGDFQNPDWYCPKDQDPLFEILKVYDDVLGNLMKLPVRLIIATGLHQKPHKHLTYYWRIKEHKKFMKMIGVSNYLDVIPRMSRDFLIEFETQSLATEAQEKLVTYTSQNDGLKIFSVDNRGKSLFVELTYPNEIEEGFNIKGDKLISDFKQYISFVAIKNGEHDGVGYLIDTLNIIPSGTLPLKKIYDYLIAHFD